MKYIITGGGSGGHVYPAISIAKIIKRSNPNTFKFLMRDDLIFFNI